MNLIWREIYINLFKKKPHNQNQTQCQNSYSISYILVIAIVLHYSEVNIYNYHEAVYTVHKFKFIFKFMLI